MLMKLQSLSSQGLYFFIAGISAVCLDYTVYISSLEVLGPIFSKIFGFYSGVIVSFLINGTYTFRAKTRPLFSANYFVKYITALTVSMTINVIINYFCLLIFPYFHSKMLLAFCLATIFSMCFNFIIMKYWVFK